MTVRFESKMVRRVCLLVALATISAWPQTPSTAVSFQAGPVYITADSWPDAQIVIDPLSAQQQDPSSTRTIKASDLKLVEEDEQTVRASGLETFRDTKEGMAIALLIDVSPSMSGMPLEAVKRGLLTFVQSARDNDSISIATFAGDVAWETRWGAKSPALTQAIQGLKARGSKTLLFDSMLEALDRFDDPYPQKTIPARRRLIVISDGADEGSKATLRQVIDRATRKRVPIDAIGYGNSKSPSVATLAAISKGTAGAYRPASNEAEVELRLSRGIEALLETPVATFSIQNLRKDGKAHMMGVHWSVSNTTDSLSVALPQAAWWSFDGRIETWHLAVAGGAIVLLIAIVFLTRKPKRAAPAPSSVAAKPQPVVASTPRSVAPPIVREATVPETPAAPRLATVPERRSAPRTVRASVRLGFSARILVGASRIDVDVPLNQQAKIHWPTAALPSPSEILETLLPFRIF